MKARTGTRKPARRDRKPTEQNVIREQKKAMLKATGHFTKPRPLFSTHQIEGGTLHLLPGREHLTPLFQNLAAEARKTESKTLAYGQRKVTLSHNGITRTFLLKKTRRGFRTRKHFKKEAGYKMSAENEVLMNYQIRTELGIPTERPIGFVQLGRTKYSIYDYHEGIDKRAMPDEPIQYSTVQEAIQIRKKIVEAGFGFAFDDLTQRTTHLIRDRKTGKLRLIDTESVYRRKDKKKN